MEMKEYMKKLYNLRNDRDMTEKQLGGIISKSQQGYDNIEKGRAKLTADDLKKLCLFYHVSADYILGLPKGLPYPER